MSGQSLIAREAEVLRILQAIRRTGEEFTLIGGYAVNAYSPLPRYSVDCDIVVAYIQLEGLSSFLSGEGYDKGEAIYRDDIDGLEKWKFVKTLGEEEVSVGLLVDGVKCRQTEAMWKEEEVRKESQELRVAGVNGSVLSSVASRDLLIAMKLHSGRYTDLRDVVMLARDADWEKVRDLSNKGLGSKLITQLKSDIAILGDEQFENQVRAAFASKKHESQRILSTQREVGKLLKKLSTTEAESRRNNARPIRQEERAKSHLAEGKRGP